MIAQSYPFLICVDSKYFPNFDDSKGEDGGVRPGAAGLLVGIKYSRVRDSSWMYLTSFVTTRIVIELVAVQRKLPNCVVVRFQLCSARTFHVTLPPGYIRAGRDPLERHQHLRQYKPHRT